MSTRLLVGYQLALIAVAALLLTTAAQWGVGNAFAVAGLAVIAAAAERGRVRMDSTFEASISLLPTVFAAAVFGPFAAAIVSASSYLGDFPLERGLSRGLTHHAKQKFLRWGIYTCTRATYGAAAGFAAAAVKHISAAPTTSLIFATVTAAVVAEPLDVAFAALTLRLRGGAAIELLKSCGPMLTVSVTLYTPIVAALAVAYATVSPWTLPLFFVPALAAQRLFGLYQEQRHLARQLVDANAELEEANLSFATALVTTLDARDRYTAGHSAAVAIYARDIAARMGLPDEETGKAHLAGLVHDIGKIGLPAGLLEKPGALTLDERREMQSHSVIGERILAKVASYEEIAQIVRHHHERVDGGGYPEGIADEDIPLLSRIIAVADAYNAMTSDRPYRDAMPSRVARLRLAQAVESQFDTSVVAAFEAVLASATEAYRMARSEEFTFDWQHQEAESLHSLESSAHASSSLSPVSISA